MKRKDTNILKSTPMEKASECIDAYRNVGEFTDPQGSYTGIYRYAGNMSSPLFRPYDFSMVVDDYDDEPVQDVDDL